MPHEVQFAAEARAGLLQATLQRAGGAGEFRADLLHVRLALAQCVHDRLARGFDDGFLLRKLREHALGMLLEHLHQDGIGTLERRSQQVEVDAHELYGPGITQSITNTTIIEPLRQGRTAKVLLRDDTLRSLIYTPDASRAMARLGNTPDAYGQTWHLPCDDDRPTYRQFIERAAAIFGTEPRYKIVKRWQLGPAGLFSAKIRDAAELLPRYEADNVFVSDKFKKRFPDFRITTFAQGLAVIGNETVVTG